MLVMTEQLTVIMFLTSVLSGFVRMHKCICQFLVFKNEPQTMHKGAVLSSTEEVYCSTANWKTAILKNDDE